jgi:Dolichyl-phosphate-mannose-protein mannosyltransferase
MRDNVKNSLSQKLLISILLIAAILRFQGIFWGIPIFDPLVHSYHPDEPKIIEGAYSFPRHILTNTDLRYPTFYHYFLGTLSIPVKLVFRIKGWSFDTYKIYMAVFGRFVSVLLGLGSIFLAFVLAKRLYNEKVGLLSALFLSLSLYHVQNSGWATLDVPNSFFFILTLYCAFKTYEEPTPKFYFLTGVSLGILVGTKYNGAIVLISILILHYYRTLKNEEKTIPNIFKSSLSKNLGILLLSAGVTFLLTTPGIILTPTVFVHSLLEQLNLDTGRKYRVVWGDSFFFLIAKNFMTATDPILGLVMLLGLVYPFRRSWDKEIPLLAPLIIFFVSFGALETRQLISVLPLTSILGARAVFHLYEKNRFLSKPVWVSLLAAWTIFAVAYNSAGILLRKDDTRTEAAYYIEQNIPNGATIGATSIGDYPRWSWMFPRIDREKYKIVDALEKPKFIILTSYDYAKMGRAFLSNKLHNYEWDRKYAMEWYKSHPPSEEVFRFYDDILNEKGGEYKYRLIEKFAKNIFIPIEFPSPEIRIYEKVEG